MEKVKKGLHGEHIRFLKSAYGYSVGATVIPTDHESGLEICSWPSQQLFFLDKRDEGTLYVREYFEMRVNAFDTEYTPREMTQYRLDRKREHAKNEPNGRTAELVGYIDWLLCRMEKMYEVLDDMPTSIEDLVDFSGCSSDEN